MNTVPRQTSFDPQTDAPTPAPQVTESYLASIRHQTKLALEAQPKVTVRLPKINDPNVPNYETVQVNGYLYQIMRGQDVQVPRAVKDILAEANII